MALLLKSVCNGLMPSQDIWKFTPVSYRTLARWGRCPTFTLFFHLITLSKALVTADHVRALADLFITAPAHLQATWVAMFLALFNNKRILCFSSSVQLALQMNFPQPWLDQILLFFQAPGKQKFCLQVSNKQNTAISWRSKSYFCKINHENFWK